MQLIAYLSLVCNARAVCGISENDCVLVQQGMQGFVRQIGNAQNTFAQRAWGRLPELVWTV